MRPKKTWIVLADTQRARIAVNDGPGKGVYGQRIRGLKAHPVTELSDAPGMTRAPAGPDRGNIADPDLKGQAARDFAGEIVDFLSAAYATDTFQRLVLIAPPAMLGFIRAAMPANLDGAVRASIAKDLSRLPLARLPAHIEHVVAV